MWLKIASELQKLSELLDTAESVKTEERRLRQRYKQRLLALKEQAIRNSLMEDKSNLVMDAVSIAIAVLIAVIIGYFMGKY